MLPYIHQIPRGTDQFNEHSNISASPKCGDLMTNDICMYC